ncbi:DNA modification methylase [Candidatus Magnetoovum chiemensis]|nr:DNA modification methylase [Candidatus Magnetoovum chiemensis]
MKIKKGEFEISEYLSSFIFTEKGNLFAGDQKTKIEYFETENSHMLPKFINEFWTSKQRQANSIHEITYRACFKPQLPAFFISLLTKPNDIVYDPFSGRGTTIIESALLGRNIISNDLNRLSKILCRPRLFVPDLKSVEKRLDSIPIINIESDIDLSMFYNQETLKEILSLKKYLAEKEEINQEDEMDSWIRMVATNRLTGHSNGFFSVYTLPPNQAVSPENQKKINEKRKQIPPYRDTKEIILKKTKDLLRDLDEPTIALLRKIGNDAIFLNEDARATNEILNNSIQLTVTSPPFLDIVKYADDNWLRCWFNNIDANDYGEKITMSKNIEDWCNVMHSVFNQLYRITKPGGYVAFEVGEVRNGKIKLDEHIVNIGIKQGFFCEGIMINEQFFTKTANIWGISNNEKGTNSNRIAIFKKK